MGEGRGVVERAEVSSQVVPLECEELGGHLAHYERKMFRFEISLRGVQALSCNHGHWLVWLPYQKCELIVCCLVGQQRVYEGEQLVNLLRVSAGESGVVLRHDPGQSSLPRCFQFSPSLQ